MSRHARPPFGLDFDRAPFLVIWETTRACDLACKHCRAEAAPGRDPDELTTVEAKHLLEDVRRFGPIVFVFSGGDCLKRPDLVELIAHGADLGLRMAATPATTHLATTARIREMKDAGLARLAVSLDGSRPEIHDAFRRVDGSFDRGIEILDDARRIGLSTQVNTVVGKHNLGDLDDLAVLMSNIGIVFWEVFMLVPIGRAKLDDLAGAEAFERVFHRLYEIAQQVPFDVKMTAAPQYNRVVLQQKAEEKKAGLRKDASDVLTSRAGVSTRDGIGRARNVNDGDGFVFVDHRGNIFPSGFLPLTAGNVRHDDLVDVYRNSSLFRALRDRSRLGGKCGVCEFRRVCGGSRARAWAITGDALAEEPMCAYVPRNLQTGASAAFPT